MHKIVNNKFYCLKVAIFGIFKTVNKKIGNCENQFSHKENDDDADADWVVKFVNIFVEKFWFETLLENF